MFTGLFETRTILGSKKYGEAVRTYLDDIQLAVSRMGRPEEFTQLVLDIIQNPMLSGSAVRLDAAGRIVFL